MKYLVTEHRSVTVEAESEHEAEEAGAAMLDEGTIGVAYSVQVEPLTRETRE